MKRINPHAGAYRFLNYLLIAVMLASGLSVASLSPLAPVQGTYAAPAGCAVSGEAYAANVSALGLITTGKVAHAQLPPGETATAVPLSLGAVGVSNLGLSVLPSTSYDTSTPGKASALSTAGVANVSLNLVTPLLSLLGVDLDADVIAVSANSTSTGPGTTVNTGTMTVVNLAIAGQSTRNGPVAANTTINVGLNVLGNDLNIATIVLNEQVVNGDGSFTVNGVHITLLGGGLVTSLLGINGGDIILASATSKAACSSTLPSPSPSPSPDPCTNGEAYGLEAKVLNLVDIDKVGLSTLPPGGSNSVVGAGIPLLGTLGAINSSVNNTSGGGQTQVTSQASVASLNLANPILNIGGLVSVGAITANAQSQTNGVTASSTGSVSIVDLKIAGVPVDANNLVPGQVLNVPGGLVSVKVNEQITGGNGVNSSSITVNALHITVLPVLGLLPNGLDVVVGSASSSVACHNANPSASPSASPSGSPNASPSASPSGSPSASPSASPGGSPNPSTPPAGEGTPPLLSNLFLVGTGQVPPPTGRVTFLGTIQDNAQLGGVQASSGENGPWQTVVNFNGFGAGPIRFAAGFDVTDPAYGGNSNPGDHVVYLRPIDAEGTPGPTLTLIVTYPSSVESFTDNTGDPASVTAISELAARGIIKGYGDGTVGPNDPTVRAQMAALIARSTGWGGENRGNEFPDRGPVDDELWRLVGVLQFHNVAKGYTDTPTCQSAGTTAPCYIPLDQVSRVQTISFITRAMVTVGYWNLQEDDPNLYPNIPASSGHRRDLATYIHYVGAVPGTNPSGNWVEWNTAAPRSFFAQALYKVVLWRENNVNWGQIPRP